jgi:hypothetical protein
LRWWLLNFYRESFSTTSFYQLYKIKKTSQNLKSLLQSILFFKAFNYPDL